MQCHYFFEARCQSCQWLSIPYTQQLLEKQQQFCEKLQPYHPKSIFPPVSSLESSFRNKAKMAVLGTVEKPILGMVNHNQEMVDLCECPLYTKNLQQALETLKTYIKTVGLVPYNIRKKRGELKFIILTSHENRLMLRFVLRSNQLVNKLRTTLDYLYELIPTLAVVSVNIQPKHAAILEGEEEIVLSDRDTLPVMLNHVPLFIRPQSFFQTNTEIAKQLYSTAKNWINEIELHKEKPINEIWDLFCGVGGFGLHCTYGSKQLTGIEINPQAIACAKQSAALMGIASPDFRALDSTHFALAQQKKPDIVLVNPPRRGLGESLANYLEALKPNYILYSSCNLDSQLSDISLLSGYQIVKAQLFDMFPHTAHTETMVLLERIID